MALYATMGRQLFILLILTALTAEPVANAAELPPEPGRCPNAIKPLPRNVTRAVDRIVADMYPEFRDKLLATKREDLPQFPYKNVIVRALGLKKLNRIVERPDTPGFRGMVKKIPHLLQIVD